MAFSHFYLQSHSILEFSPPDKICLICFFIIDCGFFSDFYLCFTGSSDSFSCISGSGSFSGHGGHHESQPLSWYLKVMSHGQFRAACCSIVLEFGLGVLLVQNFYRNRFLNYFHTLLIIPTFLCQLPLNPVHISKLHAVFYSKTLSHFTGNVQCFLMIPNILLIFLASSAQ